MYISSMRIYDCRKEIPNFFTALLHINTLAYYMVE